MKHYKALVHATILSLCSLYPGFSQQVLAQDDLRWRHDTAHVIPLEIMTAPQSLMTIWATAPVPLSKYTVREKDAQRLINQKTTDGIVTYSPVKAKKEWTEIDNEAITPFTWKWIDFQLSKEDGSTTLINLCRPHWWIKSKGAGEIGRKIFLDMPEMGVQGWATVTNVRINQLDTRVWNENREGDYLSRPITGKFEHHSNEIYLLTFGTNPEPLRVTGLHPIWSADRNKYIAAKDLVVGETVKTKDSQVTLKSRTQLNEPIRVYNLEVYRDHNFLVSTDQILVHNTCFPFKSLRGKSSQWLQKQKPKGWKQVPTDYKEGWKWIDENGKERLRFMRPNGKNASASKFGRQENGYIKWNDAQGNALDIDGNIIPLSLSKDEFEWRAHIPYEGIYR